jgi:hypothetical protein
MIIYLTRDIPFEVVNERVTILPLGVHREKMITSRPTDAIERLWRRLPVADTQ